MVMVLIISAINLVRELYTKHLHNKNASLQNLIESVMNYSGITFKDYLKICVYDFRNYRSGAKRGREILILFVIIKFMMDYYYYSLIFIEFQSHYY